MVSSWGKGGDSHVEGELEYPKRVYARLDQSEPLNSGRDLLFFDAIDADAVDRVAYSPSLNALVPGNPFERTASCAVTVEAQNLGAPVPPHSDSEADDNGWFQFQLQYDQGGAALVYPVLNAIGRPAYIQDFQPAQPRRSAELEHLFSLDAYVTTPAEVTNEISRLSAITSVTVYDVGQGSAAGLNCRTHPVMYADLGGGVLGHSSTFPSALLDFCYTQSPLVVLSHWDWDHWWSGNHFAPASGLTWIAPNQKIGKVHANFAQKILAAGKLLIWPQQLGSVGSNSPGKVRVVKATGSGRNHSGLAVEVTGPAGSLEKILLPGDARYSSIPGVVGSQYHSVVAPHHGADMKSPGMPRSSNQVHSRVVYSCGSPNNFGHPRPTTEQSHNTAGWPHTPNVPSTNVARYTLHRWPNGLGHVALGWSSGLKGVPMSCGNLITPTATGNCTLAAQQD